MGAQGTTTIDFGTFPGTTDATVDVTGQTGIVSGSLVEAWIRPEATADHTADEHWVESIMVQAGNIVAATGFTIYARCTNQIQERDPLMAAEGIDRISGIGTRPGPVGPNRPVPAVSRAGNLWGLWTVAWVWN